MAHEITTNDVFGEVRANGKKAWHGLGVEIREGLTAAEAFQEIGLDWETELLPIYAATWNARTEETKRIKIHGRRLHVRTDLFGKTTNEDDGSLGIVSDSYKPISNASLADFADLLCGLDASISIETAGSLRGGKRVFALCKLPKAINVTDEDVLINYVLITNAHDGSAAFSCYLTSVRVVCQNTLTLSEFTGTRRTTFEHRGDVTAKIEEARRALGIMLTEADRFEAQVHALAKRELTPAELVDYCVDCAQTSYPSNEAKREEMIGRLIKNAQTDPRQDMDGVRGTAWAALNAVTQYHDHERGRGKLKARKRTDARVHASLFGTAAKAKAKAFAGALAL